MFSEMPAKRSLVFMNQYNTLVSYTYKHPLHTPSKKRNFQPYSKFIFHVPQNHLPSTYPLSFPFLYVLKSYCSAIKPCGLMLSSAYGTHSLCKSEFGVHQFNKREVESFYANEKFYIFMTICLRFFCSKFSL